MDGRAETADRLTYNNIFRWYRSGWGRYTQADPIGLESSLNLYGYVDDDPIGTIDPTGLDLLVCTRKLYITSTKKIGKYTIGPVKVGSPGGFVSHVFYYSTKNKTGCGLGPNSGLGGLLSGGFKGCSSSGMIEYESPYDASGNMKPGYQCQVVSTDPKKEDCAVAQCKGAPKSYSLSKGNACYDFVESVLEKCKCGF